ncbi:hypothetical protein EN866_33475 [Mesorhizobium sp. M2D.F.Ca.ET.223.01.1.1]|uniref:hypothetical protein n=1 Tax=Mesorhizobium sp. M2D.F.Ca.ET.223.01.1.1 TaxID=2563940 RepID=UPI001091C16D|nr:hypothetical protein [Mesorhizobium sp. M2D.F.Ca.ET.223.01.1.1]TGR84257.1 hypothetical protein EN866_33475 [Mesorhizobium sp. M2D.F.Ca.ET.223.01.1.1]TGT75193.1 hypothetical protein EN802_09320 [bacterium M00.F.Ca.ET.159.01.1.1]TGT88060.1 hypothetical protein EN800_06210 [bacterium M00.F.Ca.ET.157.01.1.1]
MADAPDLFSDKKIGAAAVVEPETSHEFDWFADRSDVIVDEQRAVAVYRNKADGVVVRQEGYPDEDMFVVLRDDDAVAALIAALQREIGGKR